MPMCWCWLRRCRLGASAARDSGVARSIPAAQRPVFAFGGPAFNDRPELVGEVPGTFLGETIQSGIDTIERLMNEQKAMNNGK